MAATYRVGIIGCSPMAIGSARRRDIAGKPAPAHSHVDGYQDHPQTELVAVCDLDPAALARYTEFWGPGVATYTNSDEMLANENLDLVSIVTPDNRHHHIFAAAAKSGLKGILCEKPIATSLPDADMIIAAARDTGVKAVINHTRRFDPLHRQTRRQIDEGAIGTPRHVIGFLTGPRAMLFRNGTHLVNTMMLFLDGTPTWVQAAYADAEANYGSGYHSDGGRDPDLEPAVVATIGFDDGSRAVFNSNKEIAGGFEVTVYGTTGIITLGATRAERRFAVEGQGFVTQQLPRVDGGAPAIVNVIDDLVTMVETDGDPLPNLREARLTLEILLAITESASRDGVRVYLENTK